MIHAADKEEHDRVVITGTATGPAVQGSDQKIRELQDRLSLTEQRQQTLISFFANALKDPRILHRLLNSINTAGVQRLAAPPGQSSAATLRGHAAPCLLASHVQQVEAVACRSAGEPCTQCTWQNLLWVGRCLPTSGVLSPLHAGRKKRRARGDGAATSIAVDGGEQLDLDLDMQLDPDSPELDPLTGMPLDMADQVEAPGGSMPDAGGQYANGAAGGRSSAGQIIQYTPNHKGDFSDFFMQQMSSSLAQSGIKVRPPAPFTAGDELEPPAADGLGNLAGLQGDGAFNGDFSDAFTGLALNGMVDPPLVGTQQQPVNLAPTHLQPPTKASSSSGPLPTSAQGEGYVSSVPGSSGPMGRRVGQGQRTGRTAGLPAMSQPGAGGLASHEPLLPVGQHYYPAQVRRLHCGWV
jgi:hypothetical protein